MADVWTRLEALDFLPKEVRRELYLVGMTDMLEVKEPMPKDWRWRLELQAGTIKRDIARVTRQAIDNIYLTAVPKMGHTGRLSGAPRLDLLEPHA